MRLALYLSLLVLTVTVSVSAARSSTPIASGCWLNDGEPGISDAEPRSCSSDSRCPAPRESERETEGENEDPVTANEAALMLAHHGVQTLAGDRCVEALHDKSDRARVYRPPERQG
jgi:hypothetical protein